MIMAFLLMALSLACFEPIPLISACISPETLSLACFEPATASLLAALGVDEIVALSLACFELDQYVVPEYVEYLS